MKMSMNTTPKMELEILQSVLKAWDDKVKADQSPFWKSLANSYHSKEKDDFEMQKFISCISFYPDLIKEIIGHIRNEDNISFEITFFSTLLPRHYWNFPIIKPLKIPKGKIFGNPENYYFSRSPKYLELYREEICKLIESDQHKFNLKRVIILADKERYFRGSRLFSIKDFEKDNKFFINQKSIESHKIAWNNVKKEQKKINAYSIGIDKKTLELFFEAGSKGLKNKELENILKKLTSSEDYFYNFYSANSKEVNPAEHISILKFYLDNLHSKDSSRIFVVGDSGRDATILKKNYSKYSLKELQLSPEFSPDLGIIKITNCTTDTVSKIILNTYMDIIKDVVKMEVITEGHSKFKDLNKDIEYILNETKNQSSLFSETKLMGNEIISKDSGN